MYKYNCKGSRALNKRLRRKTILFLLIASILAGGIAYISNWYDETMAEIGQVYEIKLNIPHTKSVLREVTAYSEIDSCHYANCIMASGKRAYIGAIACPRDIKLGTKIKIANKWYICEDRTALSLDGRFDIFMGYGKKAYNKAIKFGKQLLPVIK